MPIKANGNILQRFLKLLCPEFLFFETLATPYKRRKVLKQSTLLCSDTHYISCAGGGGKSETNNETKPVDCFNVVQNNCNRTNHGALVLVQREQDCLVRAQAVLVECQDFMRSFEDGKWMVKALKKDKHAETFQVLHESLTYIFQVNFRPSQD